MAMLAEPRKKQRIGPNPRGKFFTDDQDNVGRQMLMKMGWKTGNGLGASSQGMNEPIKPKIHTDARGLGFDKTKDPWVAHNEEFEQLLKNLNANSSSDNEGKKVKPAGEESDEDGMGSGGLETKSKSSRARIHYHKFVKNKDLSRASTKDISCIFGRAVNERDNSLIGYPEEHSKASVEADDAELENKYEASEETAEVPFESVDDSSNEKRKKKKKKKRNKEKENDETEAAEITEIQHEEIQIEENSLTENTEVKTKKKKKKKKHRNEEIENDVDEERNEVADVTQTTQFEDDVPHISPSEQESVKKRKKSKRKHVSDEEQTDNIEAAEVAEPICEAAEEEQRPKKKKKRKKSKEDSNDELLPTEDEPEVEKKVSTAAEPKQEEPAAKPDNIESFGSLQFINRGSIEDYFRNKRLEMLNRLKPKGNTNE